MDITEEIKELKRIIAICDLWGINNKKNKKKLEELEEVFKNGTSIKVIHEMIENGEIENGEENNLGFILTVIRDNCSCDSTYELLDKLLKSMR